MVAWLFYPFAHIFTDRYLSRVWRSLRTPGTGGRDAAAWTATVWLGDLTDMARLYYVQDGLHNLYLRFLKIFPELRGQRAVEDGQRSERVFYTPGNHDVTLHPHSNWVDPGWWKLYWTLQTKEYSRWKFKSLFGTSVFDLGWDAPAVSQPNASLDATKALASNTTSTRYITKLEHTMRQSLHARVPLELTHSDGSPPTKVAELILLDTTDIISLQRMGRDPFAPNPPPDGQPGQEADWRFGGGWWFIDSISKDWNPSVPRILMTHIPLWRKDVAGTCQLPSDATMPAGVQPVAHSSMRRISSRPIVPGTDAQGTYENLVGEQWSRFILEKIKPSVIFTGDDHDVCHHLHRNVGGVGGVDVPELTVPALSLTSGVSRPGYARLSLWQNPTSSESAQEEEGARGNGTTLSSPAVVDATMSQTRIEYTPCALPAQISIWLTWYPLALALSIAALTGRRWWSRRRQRGRSRHRPHRSHARRRSQSNTATKLGGSGWKATAKRDEELGGASSGGVQQGPSAALSPLRSDSDEEQELRDEILVMSERRTGHDKANGGARAGNDSSDDDDDDDDEGYNEDEATTMVHGQNRASARRRKQSRFSALFPRGTRHVLYDLWVAVWPALLFWLLIMATGY